MKEQLGFPSIIKEWFILSKKEDRLYQTSDAKKTPK